MKERTAIAVFHKDGSLSIKVKDKKRVRKFHFKSVSSAVNFCNENNINAYF